MLPEPPISIYSTASSTLTVYPFRSWKCSGQRPEDSLPRHFITSQAQVTSLLQQLSEMTGTPTYLPEQVDLILEQYRAGATTKQILSLCVRFWPKGPKGIKWDGQWRLDQIVYVIKKCNKDPR